MGTVEDFSLTGSASGTPYAVIDDAYSTLFTLYFMAAFIIFIVPRTLVLRSAAGSSKDLIVEAHPAIWNITSTFFMKHFSTSFLFLTSPLINSAFLFTYFLRPVARESITVTL